MAPEDGSDVIFKGQQAWSHSSLDEKLVGGGVICARDCLVRASKRAFWGSAACLLVTAFVSFMGVMLPWHGF